MQILGELNDNVMNGIYMLRVDAAMSRLGGPFFTPTFNTYFPAADHWLLKYPFPDIAFSERKLPHSLALFTQGQPISNTCLVGPGAMLGPLAISLLQLRRATTTRI